MTGSAAIPIWFFVGRPKGADDLPARINGGQAFVSLGRGCEHA
ncbi:hypothetical protein PY32053_01540 [Paracoccus yeei]|uniref:Uncharacterized protein n=1 Tax=Paracoccus yeei TaxID=147645 RepID=A0A386UKE3_9RHOB|nr:hypothetical protein PY32053_01540 [Paracoccus yeei]